MRGLMQHDPLIVNRILERAVTLFPRQEIVTWTKEGPHRESFARFGERVGRLASALAALGVKPGDRVATFAFNTFRHQELYFAVPCMGAVLHTLNIRLHADQIVWIANHAEDRVLLVDALLLPVLAPPEPDEDDAAAMCDTSGTAGHPKGVVYSHRSTVLHATMINLAGSLGLTDRDAVLPVVPMFHANAWGIPYAAMMTGAKLVLAGSASADPAVLVGLVATERVTVAAGVPTRSGTSALSPASS